MRISSDREDLARIALICPGYRIRVVERIATRFYNARFKTAGLTAVQFGLLIGIETAARPRAAELAERSGADPSTLARNLRVLERDGLVAGEGGRGRSGKRFALTAQGRNTLARAVVIWERAHVDLVAMIGEASLQDGMQFLTTLEQAAKAQLSERFRPVEPQGR
jgi:DNA-binding MarR family transcriptional regulator